MKRNLLLVDDEVALVETMRELLEHDALNIFVAHNGREALQLMENQPIDCVISDIKMPVMDGFTFMHLARDLGHNMPFIFCSGHACDKLKARADELGAIALLSKPCFEELEILLHQSLLPQMKQKLATALI